MDNEEYTFTIYMSNGRQKKTFRVKKLYKAILQGREEVLVGGREEIEKVVEAKKNGTRWIETRFGSFDPFYLVTYREAVSETENYINEVRAGRRIPELVRQFIKEIPALDNGKQKSYPH